MTRIFKDGCRSRTVEYEARELDQFGDAQDVQHFETAAEAIVCAENVIHRGAPASVVEKHTSKRPAHMFADPDKYEIIATFGNTQALREGGWLAPATQK